MRKFLFLIVFVATGYVGLTQYRQFSLGGGLVAGVESADDSAFTRALENRASGIQLED